MDRVLTWVTLSIAAVICLVLGFGAVAMANSWWTEEAPVASADQQLPDGQSRFDQAGFDFLNRQGHATVDVTASASASELGLPTAGQTPIDTLVPISLEVRGDASSLEFNGVSRFELTTSGRHRDACAGGARRERVLDEHLVGARFARGAVGMVAGPARRSARASGRRRSERGDSIHAVPPDGDVRRHEHHRAGHGERRHAQLGVQHRAVIRLHRPAAAFREHGMPSR